MTTKTILDSFSHIITIDTKNDSLIKNILIILGNIFIDSDEVNKNNFELSKIPAAINQLLINNNETVDLCSLLSLVNLFSKSIDIEVI